MTISSYDRRWEFDLKNTVSLEPANAEAASREVNNSSFSIQFKHELYLSGMETK